MKAWALRTVVEGGGGGCLRSEGQERESLGSGGVEVSWYITEGGWPGQYGGKYSWNQRKPQSKIRRMIQPKTRGNSKKGKTDRRGEREI